MSNSVLPHGQQPTRLPCPWDSPGKNTGVGCHFLLQCMKVKSESEVAQSCPIPSNAMDYSLPGSSIHGIVQARVQAWAAIAFYEILILINCKKDSDHPFHKSYRKKFFSHQENPLNFCKVQFCEVFGWMGSSRVQVCVAFC